MFLKQRAAERDAPIQMCDLALSSRNHAKAAEVWTFCWPTVWRMEGGRL